MSTQYPISQPYQQFFDANGVPLAGGKVYTAEPGTVCTSTSLPSPKATYTDSTGTSANTNPIVLDSAGRANFWGTGFYKMAIYDAAGNLIKIQDNVPVSYNYVTPVTVPWVYADVYPSLNAAISAIGATPTTLLVRTASFPMTGPAVVPATMSIQIEYPGSIANSTYTLTINGPFSAPLSQVFTGTGAITGLNQSYIQWFGGKGDNSTDNAAAWNLAKGTNAKVIFPEGTYLFNSQISATTQTIVDIEGQGDVMFVVNTATSTKMNISGVLASSATSFTGDLNEGDLSIQSADPTTDMVILTSTDLWSQARSTYIKGELARVQKYSGGYIYLETPLYDDYVHATTTMTGITPVKVNIKNIKVKSPSDDSASNGVHITYAIDSELDNFEVTTCGLYCLQVENSYNVNINNNRVVGLNQDAEGLNYGLAVLTSQNVVVTGGYYKAGRHGIMMGGYSQAFPNRNITFRDLIVDSFTALEALDSHENAEYVLYDNITSENGVGISAINFTMANSRVYNRTAPHAMLLGPSKDEVAYINILNTYIENNNSASGTIYLTSAGMSGTMPLIHIQHITMDGLTIVTAQNSTSNGIIRMECYSGGADGGMTIDQWNLSNSIINHTSTGSNKTYFFAMGVTTAGVKTYDLIVSKSKIYSTHTNAELLYSGPATVDSSSSITFDDCKIDSLSTASPFVSSAQGSSYFHRSRFEGNGVMAALRFNATSSPNVVFENCEFHNMDPTNPYVIYLVTPMYSRVINCKFEPAAYGITNNANLPQLPVVAQTGTLRTFYIASGTDPYGTYIVGDTLTSGHTCTVSGTKTLAPLSGVVGSISGGSKTMTVNSISTMVVGQYITIAGVTGTKLITKIDGTTVTIDVASDATVTTAAISYQVATWS